MECATMVDIYGYAHQFNLDNFANAALAFLHAFIIFVLYFADPFRLAGYCAHRPFAAGIPARGVQSAPRPRKQGKKSTQR